MEVSRLHREWMSLHPMFSGRSPITTISSCGALEWNTFRSSMALSGRCGDLLGPWRKTLSPGHYSNRANNGWRGCGGRAWWFGKRGWGWNFWGIGMGGWRLVGNCNTRNMSSAWAQRKRSHVGDRPIWTSQYENTSLPMSGRLTIRSPVPPHGLFPCQLHKHQDSHYISGPGGPKVR